MFERIFLVAGHGKDPGALAIDGTSERQIVVSVAKKVEELFPQSKVITVGVYEALTLREKIEKVNGICKMERLHRDSAFLVSLHCDFRLASEGVSGYYDSRTTGGMVDQILDTLAKETDRKKKWKKADTLSRFGKLGIIKDTIFRACLVEIGSLKADSNKTDGLELLSSEEGQDDIAEALAIGVSEATGIARVSKEVSPWAKKSVEKAIQGGVATNWENPQEIIGTATMEWILKKAGIFGEVTGSGVTKERFVVALDRVGAL